MTISDKIGLSDRQKKALPFLIAARSEGEGCRAAKIARQTYYDWLKEPAFKIELRRLRNEVVDDAIETLKNNVTKAINTLVTLLDANIPTLQRAVANDILGHVSKFKEAEELEKRIEVLESKSLR